MGRFLRRTHLDEIPQLYNVLRGEMSLVGPRPDDAGSERELGERYPFYALRHAVRPGIAGWAAVNNGYVDAEDAALLRFEYDVYYVRNRSLALDARILFRSALHAATLRGR